MNTTLVWVAPDATFAELLKLMDARGIHHLLVVRPDQVSSERTLADRLPLNAIAGIVSSRDLVRELARRDDVAQASGSLLAKDLMHRAPLVTATPDLTLHEAAQTLRAERLSALPVTDERGHELVGIVTQEDLLTALALKVAEG